MVGLFISPNAQGERTMVASILNTNRLSLVAWTNMTTECKQRFISTYLRNLGK